MSRATEWARLASWDADEKIPPEWYERLQKHPDYCLAILSFATRILDLSRTDKAFDSVCKDVARYGVAQWVVYLHMTGGITLSRLKVLCVRSGLLSPGRARALLIYLRYIGFIELSNGKEGGRSIQYRPTPALLAAIIHLVRAGLEAMIHVEPAAAAAVARLEEETFADALLRQLGSGLLEASVALPQETPFFRAFMHPSAGMQMLYWMIVAAAKRGDPFPPQKPIPISMSEVAQDLRVSRTHVQRMLRTAEREALIARHDDGTVQFTANLVADSSYILSGLLLGYVISAVKAQHDLALTTAS